MEAYRDRIARRIQREASKTGESPLDLAHALQVHTSTVERWFRGDRTPQPRHRKQLARHWDIPLEEFEPDLEAEERAVLDQLDRIEKMLHTLLDRLGVSEEPAEAGFPEPPAELGPELEAEQPTSEGRGKAGNGNQAQKPQSS